MQGPWSWPLQEELRSGGSTFSLPASRGHCRAVFGCCLARGPAGSRVGAGVVIAQVAGSMLLRVPLSVYEYQGRICIFKNVMLIH